MTKDFKVGDHMEGNSEVAQGTQPPKTSALIIKELPVA